MKGVRYQTRRASNSVGMLGKHSASDVLIFGQRGRQRFIFVGCGRQICRKTLRCLATEFGEANADRNTQVLNKTWWLESDCAGIHKPPKGHVVHYTWSPEERHLSPPQYQCIFQMQQRLKLGPSPEKNRWISNRGAWNPSKTDAIDLSGGSHPESHPITQRGNLRPNTTPYR